MPNRAIISAAVAYAAIGVFTYGNAVWWIDPVPNGAGALTRAPAIAAGAPLAAILWPLYWSARAQEPAAPQSPTR